MPINVTRGSAHFTIPDPVTVGVTKIIPSEIKTMIDAILTIHNEMLGIAAIYNDPVVPQSGGRVNNSGSLHQTVPNSLKARRLPGISANSQSLYNSTKNFFTGGNQRLSINNINNFINSFKTMEAGSRSVLPGDVTGMGLASVSLMPSAAKAVATTLNTVRSNLTRFNDYLNGKNGWWNGDLCARTCQISCQTSCQLACQGCNNNTCHNQNCGGFS